MCNKRSRSLEEFYTNNNKNFIPILDRSMCGIHKNMDTQEVVEELMQVCIQMRFHLNDLEQREKEILILKHIKRFENSGTIDDFPKGTGSHKKVPCILPYHFANSQLEINDSYLLQKKWLTIVMVIVN